MLSRRRICAAGQRFGRNLVSAITSCGHLAFTVFRGKFDGRLLMRYTQRLLRQVPGRLHLIVDGSPVHSSVAAKKFFSKSAEPLHLIRLPSPCSELTADEPLNQDTKISGLGKSRRSNRTEMMADVRIQLRRRQQSALSSWTRWKTQARTIAGATYTSAWLCTAT